MRRPDTTATTRDLDLRVAPDFGLRLRWTSDVFNPSNRVLPNALAETSNDIARVAVFVDSGVAEAHPSLDQQIIQAARDWGTTELVGGPWIVTGGEQAKNDPAVLAAVLERMRWAGLCRRSHALVIGGGAVLDVVGYAAAVFHRGVRLTRLPSTTLSQCDSGVGVKNGVNHAGVKNLLGSFAAPHLVINDTALLDSLGERDWRCGFAEAVKVAVIQDIGFFETLERDAEAIAARDARASIAALTRSAELHARHIAEGGDPFETGTGRPLDFGHWSAHKLESMTSHQLRHGEAVAIGVAVDCLYAAQAGLIEQADALRVVGVLELLGFGLWVEEMNDTRVLTRGLDEFAEHLGGTLSIPMPDGLGRTRDLGRIDERLLIRAIDALRERAR
ncbi:MAG: 3-dehydroquinate synthase [Planctomycetota bacterium]